MNSLYLNHNGFFEFCKGYAESKTKTFPFNFLRLPPAPPAVFLRIRKFLVLRGAEDERRQAECVRLRAHGVCRSEDGATPRRGLVGITTRSARKMKFEATMRVARAITSRFARKKFGFHHIDGAIQNKKQNCRRLWRQAWENPRGFSTGFAKKRRPPDPAKAGSMFSEHLILRIMSQSFFFCSAKVEAIISNNQKQ